MTQPTISAERLTDMLNMASWCQHGEFSALVSQTDVLSALTELSALRAQAQGSEAVEPYAYEQNGRLRHPGAFPAPWRANPATYGLKPLYASPPQYLADADLGFVYALLGADTWLEAGAIWEGNPEQRNAAHAAIAAALTASRAAVAQDETP